MTNQAKNAPAVPGQQAPARVQKDVVDSVLAKVLEFEKTGELQIPKDYVPENALKSAYLILSDLKDSSGKPALETCTRESVANSLLEMVVQGLSPMKKQCAFIVYGNKLQMQREYFGTIALEKRFGGVKDVTANVIFEGDEFKYEIDPATGRRKIISHVQSLESIDMNKIKGAYAVVLFEDGTSQAEIMSIGQIRQAWMQGATKGQSPAHKNFPDQMSLKTVISRACKPYINSSDDEEIYNEPQTAAAKPAQAAKPSMTIDDAHVIPDAPKAEIPQNTGFDSQGPSQGLTDADKEALNKQVASEQQVMPGF